MITRATADTNQADVYLRRLCEHFAHRVPASHEDRTGRIRFHHGSCQLVAGAHHLTLVLTADDSEHLADLQTVLASHLERFGTRDQLTLVWRPTIRLQD